MNTTHSSGKECLYQGIFPVTRSLSRKAVAKLLAELTLLSFSAKCVPILSYFSCRAFNDEKSRPGIACRGAHFIIVTEILAYVQVCFTLRVHCRGKPLRNCGSGYLFSLSTKCVPLSTYSSRYALIVEVNCCGTAYRGGNLIVAEMCAALSSIRATRTI